MDLKTFYLAIVYGERYNASLEVYKHEIIAGNLSIEETLHLSQGAFAKELGVSFTSVNRWENEAQTPSPLALRMIISFCEKQGLSFSYDEEKQGEQRE